MAHLPVILGVDPGLANTGVAVMRGEEVLWAATLLAPRSKYPDWLPQMRHQLTELEEVWREWNPDRVAVELIVWQGKRRGALPLAQLTGAVFGLFFGKCPTEGFWPHEVKEMSKKKGNGNTEHETDAISLCRLLWAKIHGRNGKTR